LLDFTVAGSLTTDRRGSVEERVRCVEEVLALLQKLSNPVEKAAAIRHVADRLGMEEKVLLERYRSLPRKASAADETPTTQAEAPLPNDEEVLVRLLLHEKLTPAMAAQLAADDFTDPRVRRLIALALEGLNAQGDVAVNELIVRAQEDGVCGSIVRAYALSELPYDDAGAAFRESLKALKLRRIADEIQEVKTAQIAAERAGQRDTVRTLQMRTVALLQEQLRLRREGPLPLTEVGSVNA
jgi:DNA primase